jgi:hypothetical protein
MDDGHGFGINYPPPRGPQAMKQMEETSDMLLIKNIAIAALIVIAFCVVNFFPRMEDTPTTAERTQKTLIVRQGFPFTSVMTIHESDVVKSEWNVGGVIGDFLLCLVTTSGIVLLNIKLNRIETANRQSNFDQNNENA